MELNYKEMIKALNAIEDERRIPESVVIEALKEAMCKAYKKDAELSDINVEAEINEKNSTIDIYQIYNVVENVEDDELEMSLEEGLKLESDLNGMLAETEDAKEGEQAFFDKRQPEFHNK